jgi:hypothetical protein
MSPSTISLSNITVTGMATLGFFHSNFVVSTIEEIFISHYGACVLVCFEIWRKLKSSGKLLSGQNAKHLFWTLLYMKTYSTQRILCYMINTTRKTFNKHVHHIIKLISEFTMVSYFSKNRVILILTKLFGVN